MAILDKHCFCCVPLRQGALVSSILFLLVSAASALLYVWGLLELLQRGADFASQQHESATMIFTYVVIGINGVVMILGAIIMFIGAFCYNAGSAAFFSVILAIGTVIEFGYVVYLGFIASNQLGGFGNHPYFLFLIIWFAVRAVWNFHLLITSWSLYQLFRSKPYKSGNF